MNRCAFVWVVDAATGNDSRIYRYTQDVRRGIRASANCLEQNIDTSEAIDYFACVSISYPCLGSLTLAVLFKLKTLNSRGAEPNHLRPISLKPTKIDMQDLS
jgi:hypothetical protein